MTKRHYVESRNWTESLLVCIRCFPEGYWGGTDAERDWLSIVLVSGHAVWGAVQVGETLPKDQNIVLVSWEGRSDRSARGSSRT